MKIISTYFLFCLALHQVAVAQQPITTGPPVRSEISDVPIPVSILNEEEADELLLAIEKGKPPLVDEYRALYLSGPVEVTVMIGTEDKLELTCRGAATDSIQIDEYDTTYQRTSADQMVASPVRFKELDAEFEAPGCALSLTVKKLFDIEASGGASVTVLGLQTEMLDIYTEEEARVQLKDASIGELEIVASDGSKITLNGTSRSLELEADEAEVDLAALTITGQAGLQLKEFSKLRLGPVQGALTISCQLPPQVETICAQNSCAAESKYAEITPLKPFPENARVDEDCIIADR